MRSIFTIISLGLILLASACKKDNHKPDLFIGASLKSQTWLAQPSVGYITPDTLQLLGYKADGEQTLYFNLRFKGTGNYTLIGVNQAKYYTTVGQDAVTSSYALDTTKTNTVTVESYVLNTGVMTGRFNLNFVKKQGGASADQTLSFTNGQFWVVAPITP